MVKRPQIDNEELYEHVMRLHREYEGSSARNFEEALETVVQLAEDQVLDREEHDPDWYPGKYLNQIVNAISNTDRSRDSKVQQSKSGIGSSKPPQLDPNKHPVFKTIIDDGHEITIPDAEVTAFDIKPGQLMQVAMYPIEDDK